METVHDDCITMRSLRSSVNFSRCSKIHKQISSRKRSPLDVIKFSILIQREIEFCYYNFFVWIWLDYSAIIFFVLHYNLLLIIPPSILHRERNLNKFRHCSDSLNSNENLEMLLRFLFAPSPWKMLKLSFGGKARMAALPKAAAIFVLLSRREVETKRNEDY